MNRSRRTGSTSYKTPKPPNPPSGLKPLPGLKRIKGIKGLKGLPGPRSAAPAGTVDPGTLEVIRKALAERLPITATYSKKHRELSPIALGTKGDEVHLWAYQFGGESDYKCKCFLVSGLSHVELGQGDCPIPDSDPGPFSCMDEAQGIEYAG
jgi:hypothetical protein